MVCLSLVAISFVTMIDSMMISNTSARDTTMNISIDLMYDTLGRDVFAWPLRNIIVRNSVTPIVILSPKWLGFKQNMVHDKQTSIIVGM